MGEAAAKTSTKPRAPRAPTGPHWVAMFDEDNNVPPVELIVAPCEPCKTVLNTFLPGDALGPLMIEAGPHWLEMRADEDFSDGFTLYFERLP